VVLALGPLSGWALPVTALPARVGTAFASLPLATLLHVLLSIRLKLLERLPLVGSEFGANGEEKTSVSFFQFSAGCGDFIYLREDLALVWLVIAHQGLHFEFGLLKIGVEVDELFAMS
jgi:hypothetical protein